jgi:hypothetical protein
MSAMSPYPYVGFCALLSYTASPAFARVLNPFGMWLTVYHREYYSKTSRERPD